MPFYFAGSKFRLIESDSPWRRLKTNHCMITSEFLVIFFDLLIRRSYNNKRKAVWERDPKYCENVR